ncbi:SDR family oxidoreductase [Algoriphagus sp. AGSA1]|uniref:SDR family oxidoreductase n=1 Tax=Algoriphagus sp. AGSA1 TaxID=2907213 RepID=UPI001F372750|nr:SDR family oxidoreductase [Algoriphagus sp. AGSA1]MCE7053469.1 SDR family oxidoreductase [Algoriphagus sp. AGSA1]
MNKKWFITGASSGIGRNLTAQLLEAGNTVFATLRKPELLNELAENYPGSLYVGYLELTDLTSIEKAVAEAYEKLGQIDIAVSNAGIGVFGAVEELDSSTIRKQLEVNLLGSIMLIKTLIPFLRNQPDGGHIIQVSSEGGQITYPGFSLYHASKWGIEGFVEATAQDVAAFNIRFTIAEPGPTSTEFGNSLSIAEPMEAYQKTSVNEIRRFIDTGFGELDDVADVAKAVIECSTLKNPPLRLPIGKVATKNVIAGLQKRLDDIMKV